MKLAKQRRQFHRLVARLAQGYRRNWQYQGRVYVVGRRLVRCRVCLLSGSYLTTDKRWLCTRCLNWNEVLKVKRERRPTRRNDKAKMHQTKPR